MIQQMLKFPLSAGTGRCFELHCPPDLSLVEIKKAQQVINLFFEMHEPDETPVAEVVSQQIQSEEKPDEEKQLGKPTQKTTVETKPDKPAQSQKLLKPRNGRPYVSKDSGRMSLGLKEAIKDWLKFVGKRQTELIRLINAKSACDGKQIAWMLYGQVNTSSDVIAAIQAITGIEAVLEEQVDGKKLWVCSESTPEKFTAEGEAEPDEGNDVHHGEGEPEENNADPSENFTGGGVTSQGDEPDGGVSEKNLATHQKPAKDTIKVKYCINDKDVQERIPKCDQKGVVAYLKERKKQLTKQLGSEPIVVLFWYEGANHKLDLSI